MTLGRKKYLLPAEAGPNPKTLLELEENAIYSLMNRFDGSPLPPFWGGSLSAHRGSMDVQQTNVKVSILVYDHLSMCPPITIAPSSETTIENKEKLRQVFVVTPPTTPVRQMPIPFGPPCSAIELSPAAVTTNEKTPPRRAARLPKKHPSPTKTNATSKSGQYYPSSLPTSLDPADESFVATLHSEADVARLNPVHVAVRRDVLMVRRTKSGKVFFQCGCCRHVPRSQRAKLSVVSPQGVDNLYRSFVRFMMVHAPTCAHLSAHVGVLVKGVGKKGHAKARSGIKEYWVSSALEMGLVDGEDGMSIEYRLLPPDRGDVDAAAVEVTDLCPSA